MNFCVKCKGQMKTQSGKHKQNILSSCVTLMTNTGIRFQALYDGDDGI